MSLSSCKPGLQTLFCFVLSQYWRFFYNRQTLQPVTLGSDTSFWRRNRLRPMNQNAAKRLFRQSAFEPNIFCGILRCLLSAPVWGKPLMRRVWLNDSVSVTTPTHFEADAKRRRPSLEQMGSRSCSPGCLFLFSILVQGERDEEGE